MSDFMSHYMVPIAIGAMARAAAVRRHHRDHGDDLDHARLGAGYFAGTARIYSTFSFFGLAFFFAAEISVFCAADHAGVATGPASNAAMATMATKRMDSSWSFSDKIE